MHECNMYQLTLGDIRAHSRLIWRLHITYTGSLEESHSLSLYPSLGPNIRLSTTLRGSLLGNTLLGPINGSRTPKKGSSELANWPLK